MSDIADQSFVRQELVPERAAPIKTTGFVGFLRTRLFNSPTNILLTIASALLLWFTVIPTLQIPADRCGLDRYRPQRLPGGERGTHGRRVLAVRPGEVHAIHLRLLSRSRSDGGSI